MAVYHRYGLQMTRDSMDNAIYHYNRRRGVQKTSVHLFRHTFAKNWIMNGGDLKREYDRYSLLDQAKASSEPQKGQHVKMRK